MRESLTFFAILLIVVLTTALVGPYFVNWNAHRGEVESHLSELLGGKVTIAGPIDVKLLPRPIFKLQQVRLAGTAPGQGSVSADRVDVELALTAMLRGEIRFIDADITRPHVTVRAADDHSIVLPDISGTNPDRVSVGHIAIHDGTLTLARAGGRGDVTVTGLEGDGEAELLTGPFKFAGHLDTARGPLTLTLATGAFQGGALRVKTTLDPLAGSPKTDLEGTIRTAAGPAGASALSFDGSLVAASTIPLGTTQVSIPWRVVTHLRADAGQLMASDLELRAGADERALVATGEGRLGPDLSQPAHLTLKARQIDLGRLAVRADATQPSDDPATGQGSAMADPLAVLKSFVGNADAFAALPIPVTVDYAADTVTLGAQTLTGLGGTVTLTAGKPAAGSLAVDAAEGTHLKLDGAFEPGPAAVFKGRAEAASRDLPSFAKALEPDLPAVASWLRDTIPAKSLAFAGAVDLSGVGFAAHDATLALDRSTFAGTLTFTRAVGADHARLFADVTSDALDIDALPDWRAAAEAAADLDLALTLTARAVRLARTDLGTVEAGRIGLQLSKTGSVTTLDRLALADLGGATADLTGRSDGKTAHVAGRFDVRRLHDLAHLMARIAPNAVTSALAARADVLSPALLKVAADAAVNQDGTLIPTALSVDGTAAGTLVALHLKPDVVATAPDDPLARFRSAHTPITATLTLDAPESGALLRQIGLATLPTTAIGHGRIEASTRIAGSNTLDGGFAATLGDTIVTFKGHGSLGGEGAGHLSVRGPNVAPLLKAITLATPETGALWPVEADADATVRDRSVSIKGLAGHLIGTTFSGELTYVMASGGPTTTTLASSPMPAALTGTLAIERLPLSFLTGLALGPLAPAKAGAVWPDTPFAPGFLNLPRAELLLTAASLPLTDTTLARDARLTLRLAPGVVTIADLSAALGDDGRVGGTLTLRRDGPAASLSGHIDWSGVPLATPSLAGRSRASLDLAGTGTSAATLMAGLAGSGTVGIVDARLPRFDPAAIGRVAASTDAATDAIDPGDIAQAIDHELDKAPLTLGDITIPVTIAAGILRSDTVKVEGPAVTSEGAGSLDLRQLLLSLRTTATVKTPPKDWTGKPPEVTIQWKGPFRAPSRQIDAAELVNGIAARAIARDQARIDAFQDDVRERAFFARRLKAIEAEQAATKAEADRQKALQVLPPPVTPPANVAPKSSGRPDAAAPRAADPLARLLNFGKTSAPPVPLPRAVSRSPAPQKPVDLQRTQTFVDPPPPPAILADPDLTGRY